MIVITQRQIGDVTIVNVTGRLSLREGLRDVPGGGCGQFRDAISDLLKSGKKQILIDLGFVTWMDSSGLGELVSAFTSASNQGGQVKLLNLTKRIKEHLIITQLYTVFEVFDDEAQAVRSFSS